MVSGEALEKSAEGAMQRCRISQAKGQSQKDTEEKQPRNKKAVRRNEKIPEARFFAVFFNQSHVLQEKFRRRWYFFSQNGADV